MCRYGERGIDNINKYLCFLIFRTMIEIQHTKRPISPHVLNLSFSKFTYYTQL